MSTGEKRIVELTETQSFGADDYLALDNINNTEAKKIKAKTVGKTYTIEDTEDGFTFAGDNGYSHHIQIPDVEIEEKTASGEIATFEDGGENIPMKSVVCEINPIQDLNGYDHPWSGGAGKNKFNAQKIVTDSNHPNETYIENGYLKFRTGEAVSIGFVWNSINLSCPLTFHGKVKNFGDATNSVRMDVTYSDNSTERIIIANGLSALEEVSFSVVIGDSGKTLSQMTNAWTNELRAGFDISTTQLEAGNQATSFEPYSNECPISGHTEANVSVCGVNIWDEAWEVGSLDGSGNPVATTTSIRSKNFIPIVPSANYYNYTGDNSWLTRIFYDTNKNYISTQSTKNGTFTTPPNALYMKFRTEAGIYGTTYNNDISINYPSTDKEYHAYKGQTYNIQFKDGSNPLTVYGGTRDVVSGELTATYAKKALADISKWKYSNYQYGVRVITNFFDSIPNSSLLTGMSNTFVLSDSNESYSVDRCSIMFSSGTSKTSFLISTQASGLSADASVTEINEWLRSIDAYIVYPLATPQTYQLTPTQVKSLLGTNNVWHDCNGDISVTYVKGNLGGYVYGLDKEIENIDTRITQLADFFYPVGSYYETTDTAFDPNTEWGGTWVLEIGGLVHVSAGTNYAVTTNAQDGGEATHTLTIGEMPSHYHGITIGGYTNNVSAGSGFTVPNINNQGGRSNPTTSPTGGGQAHNNMQPYKIVNRWHRTA